MSNRYSITPLQQGYSFVSDKGVTFYIFLEKSSFSPPYGDFLYDFSFFPIVPKNQRNREQNGFDPKIRETLVGFIADLLKQDNRNAIVFVCDSADRREFCRKTLFDRWYEHEAKGQYEKLDFRLVNTSQSDFTAAHISILTSKENPYLLDLQDFAQSNMDEFESYKDD